MKLSLKRYDSKVESDMKFENVDLRSNLTKVTFELESTKLQYNELEKYNIIVKGELTQWKQQFERLYSSSEKIDEHISIQRPSYDKNGCGYLMGKKSAKKYEARREPHLEIHQPMEDK